MIFIRAEVENKICGGREKKLPRSGLVQQLSERNYFQDIEYNGKNSRILEKS